MKQKPSEKSWPSKRTNRSIHRIDLLLQLASNEKRFNIWLNKCKQYSAEYIEE